MRNINQLARSSTEMIWLVGWLGLVALAPGCRANPSQGQSASGSAAVKTGPALPLERISIVGASVSAGFGGTPFGDAFTAAARRSKVDASASTFLFRDPMGDTHRQLAQATAFKATTVFALDLLFWDVYGSSSAAWHEQALADALAQLETLRASGAWIVLGDIPLITTANELMLPREAIPDAATLAKANETIRAWAARERVLMVPLVEWTEPLRRGSDVALPGGEKVSAITLMSLDGLHANALGTWYLLDKLDHYIEDALPGTPADALVFVRPKPDGG
jgi:hypothetical protein